MVVIKSHSVNFKNGKYKLENIEIKLRNSFSSKKLKKEKSKIKIKPLFKSEEIGNKKYINKNKMDFNKNKSYDLLNIFQRNLSINISTKKKKNKCK